MRWTLLLLALSVACGGSRAATSKGDGPPPMSTRDTVALARTYMQQERYPQAVAAFEEARKNGATGRSESAELASIYDITRDYTNAERIYREWLAKTPGDAEFEQQLGLTLLSQNRNAEGVAELAKALEHAPDDLHVQQDYAYGLIQTDEPKKAIAILESIVAKDQGRAEAWLLLADAHARIGAYETAIADCTSALKADGSLADALQQRARLRMRIDDYEHAFADYELLARGRAQDAGALLGSAGALIALNRLPEAKERVERAEKLVNPQHPWIQLRKAQLAWRGGDKGGYDTLVQLSKEHPDNLEIWRDIKDASRKFKDSAMSKEAAANLARLQRPPEKRVE